MGGSAEITDQLKQTLTTHDAVLCLAEWIHNRGYCTWEMILAFLHVSYGQRPLNESGRRLRRRRITIALNLDSLFRLIIRSDRRLITD